MLAEKLKKIKVIALDLDGTLLNSNHQISDYNKEILTKLNKKGYKIILSTGRPYLAMEYYVKELNLGNASIAYNGAQLRVEGELKRDTKIKSTDVKKLVKIAEKFNCYYQGFDDDKWYVPEVAEATIRYQKRTGLEYMVVDFNSFENLELTKFMFIGENEMLKEVETYSKKELGESVYQAFSTDIFYEAVSPGTSKREALKAYLELYDLEAENLLAMGDGYNDLEMLNYAGLGVVMENAKDNLKEKFIYQAKNNNEDGVGKFLEALL